MDPADTLHPRTADWDNSGLSPGWNRLLRLAPYGLVLLLLIFASRVFT
jgi:hypothetical protein